MKQYIYTSENKIKASHWVALILCFVVLLLSAVEHFYAKTSVLHHSPQWPGPLAALLASTMIILPVNNLLQRRVQQGIFMISLLLMIWASNGLIFDVLTIFGLIGDPTTGLAAHVNWAEAVSRTLAFAAAIFLVRLPLNYGDLSETSVRTNWYAYIAFFLALPYPVFRIIWAMGGTVGISQAGAAGKGAEPLILAIPWLLAAALSLCFAFPRNWMPRRLLLIAGWSATAIVASIGPAAFWSVAYAIIKGDEPTQDIATWVFFLFYGSWLLWAFAAFAATRTYQLRSK